MKIESYRETWVEIALDHLTDNIKAFKGILSPETALMAVVKADGYGHGKPGRYPHRLRSV